MRDPQDRTPRPDEAGVSRRTFLQAATTMAAVAAVWSVGSPMPTQAAVAAGGFGPVRQGITGSNAAATRYLIDEEFFFIDKASYPRPSVWDVDQAGGIATNAYGAWYRVTDSSTTLPVTLLRPFLSQSGGKALLEFRFTPITAIDGARFVLRGGMTDVLELFVTSGALRLRTPSGDIGLIPLTLNAEYGLRVSLDLDAWTTTVAVNGKVKATAAPLLGSAREIDNLLVTTGSTQTADMYFGPVRLTTGFLFHERFSGTVNNNVPDYWSAAATGATLAVVDTRSSTYMDRLCLQAAAGATTGTISAPLPGSAPSGARAIVLEARVLVTQGSAFTVRLPLSPTTDLRVTLAGGQLSLLDVGGASRGSRAFAPAVWTHLKLELNLVDSTATFRVNGKIVADAVAVASGGLSHTSLPTGVELQLPAGTTVRLSDVFTYLVDPRPADYPSAPALVDTGDVVLTVSEFGGWRTGYHLGWDLISRFPERKPYLGWYDEGIPEVADWEIKWMAENGIRARLQCWLRPSAPAGTPIKVPQCGQSLHEGYMQAEYSDAVKFAIMWENANGGATTSADFRSAIVPYWIEYYLTDPRYLKIDGRPVIAIYRTSNLVSTFGSATAAKAEIDYLRTQVQAAGLGDPILLTTGVTADSATIGLDAEYAYSREGYTELQTGTLLDRLSSSPIGVLATIGVGRDDRGWDGPWSQFATPATYAEISEWVRDTFIPSLPAGDLGKRLVILGNWNEFGEGHFIQPTGLTGFDYLEVLRDTFGTTSGPANVAPTAAQVARLGTLHPPARVLPPIAIADPGTTSTFHAEWDFATDGDAEGWTIEKEIQNLTVSGGALRGTSSTSDPGLRSPNNLGIPAAEAPYVRIRMNGTPTLGAELYFITDQDPVWSQQKGVRFYAPHTGGATYGEVDLPLWKQTTWAGTIKQIRVDPIIAPGSFEIDYVGIMNVPMTGDRLTINGVLQSRIRPRVSGGTPYVLLRPVAVPLNVRTGDMPGGGVHVVRGSDVVTVPANSVVVTVNGTPVTLSAATAVDAYGQLEVPASFFSDVLGFTVSWNPSTHVLAISA